MNNLNKVMLAKIWRAVTEFNMIKENDRILIGLSGGKDSMFMLKALAHIKKNAPFHFDLLAYTVDACFDENFPEKELKEFCRNANVDFHTEKVDIKDIIDKGTRAPCFTCAFFRRGATNRTAKALNCNKVALAHHNDDAVETFFMNIIKTGQLKTFLPVTYLSRKNLHVIRPLLYYREEEIIEYVKELGLTPLKNPCPYDGKTTRQDIKEFLPKLEAIFPGTYDNLNSAMHKADNTELWPKQKTKAESAKDYYAFWQKNKN